MFGLENVHARIKAWLDNKYYCIKCYQPMYGMSLGFGYFICPDCYKGEQPWRFPESIFSRKPFPDPKKICANNNNNNNYTNTKLYNKGNCIRIRIFVYG